MNFSGLIMETREYDLVVIGGGPAGATAAWVATLFGKRVALVEKKQNLGGAGINTGTIPSKTLRETALALTGWRSRDLFGVDLSLRREATIDEIFHHQKRVTSNERDRWTERLNAAGVEIVHGSACFKDAHTVGVLDGPDQDLILQGQYILIATGSSPVRQADIPFSDPRICDSNQILELTKLPKRLAVVGAGVIGAEYASTFAALDAEVFLIDGRPDLLPFLDHEISQSLRKAMENAGVQVRLKERVVQMDVSKPDSVSLHLSSGTAIEVDTVLVAAGRSSNTAELQLANAGLSVGPRNLIVVKEHYQTEVPHIYAAGDVIGPPALASTSREQARVAMAHAFGSRTDEELSALLPNGIFTIPEVSTVGESEESLAKKGIDFIVGRARYNETARGEIIGDEVGFIKLLFGREDKRLLGVHVIGEHATELVHLGLLVMMSNGGADLIHRTCFNYPTLGDLYMVATRRALFPRVELMSKTKSAK
ncbi:MAG TPA: Si-specific NAD(P)(+) transhydrogenase [Chthoniobacterales bacterium]|nr:Si-specific NAD(P)(+) transhydrogenase [Chthoniobacterales bacterium]